MVLLLLALGLCFKNDGVENRMKVAVGSMESFTRLAHTAIRCCCPVKAGAGSLGRMLASSHPGLLNQQDKWKDERIFPVEDVTGSVKTGRSWNRLQIRAEVTVWLLKDYRCSCHERLEHQLHSFLTEALHEIGMILPRETQSEDQSRGRLSGQYTKLQ